MSYYSFILPVDYLFQISSFYGSRKDPLNIKSDIEKIHYGIDFACPVGCDVRAAEATEEEIQKYKEMHSL